MHNSERISQAPANNGKTIPFRSKILQSLWDELAACPQLADVAHVQRGVQYPFLRNNQEIFLYEMVRNSESREIPGNLLSDFATDTLMDDPDKVFPGQGPKNSHGHEMIWAIIGNIQGMHLPMYEYLRGEQHQQRYEELRNWTLEEFEKWKRGRESSN